MKGEKQKHSSPIIRRVLRTPSLNENFLEQKNYLEGQNGVIYSAN